MLSANCRGPKNVWPGDVLRQGQVLKELVGAESEADEGHGSSDPRHPRPIVRQKVRRNAKPVSEDIIKNICWEK
jgi:hypothetical protein